LEYFALPFAQASAFNLLLDTPADDATDVDQRQVRRVRVWLDYALIDGFPQILNILHVINGIVRQSLRSLSM
jgi:hypothetical protein